MEEGWAELAASGAGAVIGLMGADDWETTRSGLVGLLARDPSGPRDGAAGHDRIGADLDRERAEVMAVRDDGDLAALRDLEAVWRSRLRRLAAADHEAARALRTFVALHAG